MLDAELRCSCRGQAVDQGKKRFLIDGFPRKMDQAIKFDESVRNSPFPFVLRA